MNLFHPAHWLSGHRFAAVVGTIGVAVAVVVIGTQTAPAPGTYHGIPIPFLAGHQDSALKGSVSLLGKRNNIDVYEIYYTHGELKETLLPNRIYLVHVPNDIVTVSSAALDLAMTTVANGSHDVDYYGYRYSDASAFLERFDIAAIRFAHRFPAQFFASQQARDSDAGNNNALANFETNNGVAFRPTANVTGGVRLDPLGALYVFVVNENSGAYLTIRNTALTGCGNGVREGAEECDDGNAIDTDSCHNACTIGIPVPFGSGATNTGAKLVLNVQPLVSTQNALLSQTGILMLRFNASATGGSAVILKKVTFNAQTGSLLSAANYTLWQDTNGDNVVDTPVQSNVAAQSNLVTFAALGTGTGRVIGSGQTIRFEVKADVSASPPTNVLQLKFATLQANYVAGQRLLGTFAFTGIKTNGLCSVSICQMAVNTLGSTRFTFGTPPPPPPPATRSGLTLTIKNIGTTDTAVRSQTGIKLLRFEVAAAASGAMFVNLRTLAQSGTLANAQNYTLKEDTDNDGNVDTVLLTGISASGSRVVFSIAGGTGVLIPANTLRTFEVSADVAASPASRVLQMALATADLKYVRGQRVGDTVELSGIKTNNVCATTCEIGVTTLTSLLWTIHDQGSLFVRSGTVPLSARHLLGGETGSTIIARLQLRAEDESIDVTTIQMTMSGAAASINSLKLFDTAAALPFATMTVAACGADAVPAGTFCASLLSQELVILKGTSRTITVKPDVKTDANGGVSGGIARPQLFGSLVTNTGSVQGTVRARGIVSSRTLVMNNSDGNTDGEVFIGTTVAAPSADVIFLRNTIGMAAIASITNGDADPDGTAVATGVTTIGAFTVAAKAHANTQNGLNKVGMEQVYFNVDAINVGIATGSLKLFNLTDALTLASCTAESLTGQPLLNAYSGSFLAHCAGLAVSGVNVAIDQNTNATFGLKANVVSPKINNATGSSLRVSLSQYTDIANHLAYSVAPTGSHLEWSDSDAGSTTNFAWVDSAAATVRSTLYQLP